MLNLRSRIGKKPASLSYVSLVILFFFLGLFIIYPLVNLIRLSLTSGREFTLSTYQEIFTRQRYVRSILNSFLLGAIVATIGTIIGFLFAYALQYGRVKHKQFFRTMAIFPLVSPPFMFALSVILLFGRNGLITAGLFGMDTLGLYGLPGLVLVQTINLFPMAYLTLSGVLQNLDPELEISAMNLGASRFRVFRTITIPLSTPGILASWLLLFVTSITDFGNPIMIGGNFDVLSVLAYLEFAGIGNLPRGAALAVILLIPTMVVFSIQKILVRKKYFATVTGKSLIQSRVQTTTVMSIFLKTFCLLITSIVILFYSVILIGSFIHRWGVDWSLTIDHFTYSWEVGAQTLWNTIFLSLISTPITAFMGLIIALLSVRKRIFGRGVLSFISLLGYGIPGTAIGIGYVLAFNTAPFGWSGTAFILVMAYVFRNLPLSVEGAIVALEQISLDIEESSRNLGATQTQTFLNITLPLIKPSLFAGATFVFVRSMTAISVVIFLVSARWNHVTVLILSQTENLRLGVASVMSTVLIVVIMIGIFLITKLTGVKQDQVLRPPYKY